MATLKSLVFFQGYEGSPSSSCSSNSPSKNFFKWTRELQTSISSALSETFQIAPGTSQTLFSGVVSLTQDGTTQYSLALAPFQSSIYQLTNTGGMAPTFRTLRSIGTDATTQVTTSVNGPILTYTFTGGTLPSLGSVQVGDNVLIGSDFNALNQGPTGIWQIVSVTSTSFSVVNPMGYIEGPITLGSGFPNQIRIFSAAGVQIGDTLIISSGFSPVSWGSYQITLVTDYYLYFSYTGSLPAEGPITTEVAIYSMAKSFVYMESDQNLSATLNGSLSGAQIIPQVANGSVFPGSFMQNGTVIYSLSVTNNSINVANVTLLSAQ
jgi:hypothetical protein